MKAMAGKCPYSPDSNADNGPRDDELSSTGGCANVPCRLPVGLLLSNRGNKVPLNLA